MATSRTILIAGAGIGGLTSALTLARSGYRVLLSEQAPKLCEVGAGIQLSPNATRILLTLGLGERLAATVTVPDGVSIGSARTGREIVSMPIGTEMEFRYGAPYWIVHRADLQSALAAAVAEEPDVILKLGTRLEDYTAHAKGVTALLRGPLGVEEQRGVALVGADGLWSPTRALLDKEAKPNFRGRTAWRATLPASAMPATMRAPIVRLWLGEHAHLVTYPLRGGELVNVVAIVRDRWKETGWSAPGNPEELANHYTPRAWAAPLRDLLRLPDRWIKWALFDSEDYMRGRGPVALLGDAAHPMLPFLAQGAGMAIEDAAILARCLAASPAQPKEGLRRYEAMRGPRVHRVQREARRNGERYHMTGIPARARDLALRLLGGSRLRERYNWLYDWQPD